MWCVEFLVHIKWIILDEYLEILIFVFFFSPLQSLLAAPSIRASNIHANRFNVIGWSITAIPWSVFLSFAAWPRTAAITTTWVTISVKRKIRIDDIYIKLVLFFTQINWKWLMFGRHYVRKRRTLVLVPMTKRIPKIQILFSWKSVISVDHSNLQVQVLVLVFHRTRLWGETTRIGK